MVKIAVAGGSGEVAREIIDVLAKRDHDITVFSRKAIPTGDSSPGNVTWTAVNYDDKEGLVNNLNGIHTLLSFVDAFTDSECTAQKNLIDAAIEAGVKRFAPSEWSSSSADGMPWYANKIKVREYLKQINTPRRVLEYTLFQPGLFLNYLGHPHKTTTHFNTFPTQIDLEHTRAIVIEGHSDSLTLTTVSDTANAVAASIEYEGEWPVVTGIQGNQTSTKEIIALGEKIRGRPFIVEKVSLENAQAGNIDTSWLPLMAHASFPPDQVETLSRMVTAGTLVAFAKGSWSVSDEWNKLFPDYNFIKIEEFLTEVWEGKA